MRCRRDAVTYNARGVASRRAGTEPPSLLPLLLLRTALTTANMDIVAQIADGQSGDDGNGEPRMLLLSPQRETDILCYISEQLAEAPTPFLIRHASTRSSCRTDRA